MGLIAGFRKARQWHREHIAAFAAVTHSLEDGLTLFQHQALDAVRPFVEAGNFKRFPFDNGKDDYLLALLPDGGELFLYSDEAEICGPTDADNMRFEAWDFRTPEDLLAALVQACTARRRAPPGTV